MQGPSETASSDGGIDREPSPTAPGFDVRSTLDAMFVTSADVLCVFDHDGRFVRVNQRLVEVLGRTETELIGHHYAEFEHPDDHEQSSKRFAGVLAGRPLRGYIENRLRTLDGDWRWLQWSAIELPDDGWIIANGRDVTEDRQRSQQLKRSYTELQVMADILRRSEEQLRRVIDSAGDAFVAMGDDGRVRAWNDAAARVFGWSRAEVMGRPLQDLVVLPELREWFASELRGYLTTGRSELLNSRLELEALRADGSFVPVEFIAWALEQAEGFEFYALARDISERRDREAVLRDSRQRLHLAWENAPIGIVIVSLDGRFLEVNPAFCAIVGRTADELFALTFQDITHPDDLDADLGLLRGLVAGEYPHYEMEKRYLRPDGSPVGTLLHVAMAHNAAGEAEYLVALILDIDHRRRATAALRRERDIFKALLAAVGVAYHFTVEGRIVDVNDELCRLTGFTRAELIGKRPPYPHWPPESEDALQAAVEALAPGAGLDIEIMIMRKSGERAPVMLNSRPAIGADGIVIGRVNTLSDLSRFRDPDGVAD